MRDSRSFAASRACEERGYRVPIYIPGYIWLESLFATKSVNRLRLHTNELNRTHSPVEGLGWLECLSFQCAINKPQYFYKCARVVSIFGYRISYPEWLLLINPPSPSLSHSAVPWCISQPMLPFHVPLGRGLLKVFHALQFQ